MLDSVTNMIFVSLMYIMGIFGALAITTPADKNKASIGQLIFFWIVMIVCSFSIGPFIAIGISASWGVSLDLTNELHGWEIVRMFLVSSSAGMIFIFGSLSCIKLLINTSKFRSLRKQSDLKGIN